MLLKPNYAENVLALSVRAYQHHAVLNNWKLFFTFFDDSKVFISWLLVLSLAYFLGFG